MLKLEVKNQTVTAFLDYLCNFFMNIRLWQKLLDRKRKYISVLTNTCFEFLCRGMKPHVHRSACRLRTATIVCRNKYVDKYRHVCAKQLNGEVKNKENAGTFSLYGWQRCWGLVRREMLRVWFRWSPFVPRECEVNMLATPDVCTEVQINIKFVSV
jgi:hypothetical protein